MTHDQLQAKCFQYVWNNFPEYRGLCFAVCNELPRAHGETPRSHMIRIRKAKDIGLVPGILDLFLFFNNQVYIFDFKVGADKFSDAQIRHIKIMLKHGARAFEINEFETFKLIVDNILNKQP